MKIEYTGRHFRIREDIKTLVEGLFEKKIARFLEDPVETRITLEADKLRRIAEIHVAHRHGILQATEEGAVMEEAIHAAMEKVEKQARRARNKYRDSRRRAGRPAEDNHWPVDVIERASVGGGETPRIIRTNRLPIKPMTIDEAALQLADSKNDFFVFLDSATERVSVLYRRRDQNYGLIAPEF